MPESRDRLPTISPLINHPGSVPEREQPSTKSRKSQLHLFSTQILRGQERESTTIGKSQPIPTSLDLSSSKDEIPRHFSQERCENLISVFRDMSESERQETAGAGAGWKSGRGGRNSLKPDPRLPRDIIKRRRCERGFSFQI